jgi:hypothetical protein
LSLCHGLFGSKGVQEVEDYTLQLVMFGSAGTYS